MEKSLYESKNPQKNSQSGTSDIQKNDNNLKQIICFNQEVNIENLKQSIQWVIENNDAFTKRISTKDKDVSEYDIKVFGVKNKTEIDKLAKKLANRLLGENKLYDIVVFKLKNIGGGIISVISPSFGDSILLNKISSQISDVYYLYENEIQKIKNIRNIIPLEIVPKQKSYPITGTQKRIYYSNLLCGDTNTVYNMPYAIRFNHKLVVSKMQSAFENLLNNNSSLRTSFAMAETEEGKIELRQKIKSKVTFNLKVVENYKFEDKNIVKTYQSFVKPFNIEKAPLLRAALYEDDNQSMLLIDTHQLVCDKFSIMLIIKKLLNYYNSDVLEQQISLDSFAPVETLDYKDYSVWESKYLASPAITLDKNYWIEKFNGCNFDSLNLPYDNPLNDARNYTGEKLKFDYSREKFKKINKFAHEHNVLPSSVFLSALYITLYKFTDQNDIVVGVPATNRKLEDLKTIIGPYENALALRTVIDENISVADFVKAVNSNYLQGLEHQSYPIDELSKALNVVSVNSNKQLFDICFNYHFNEKEKLNTIVDISRICNYTSQYLITVDIVPDTNKINFNYRSYLFKAETIDNIANNYMSVLKQLMDLSDKSVADIDVDIDKEIKLLIEENKVEQDKFKKSNSIIIDPVTGKVVDLRNVDPVTGKVIDSTNMDSPTVKVIDSRNGDSIIDPVVEKMVDEKEFPTLAENTIEENSNEMDYLDINDSNDSGAKIKGKHRNFVLLFFSKLKALFKYNKENKKNLKVAPSFSSQAQKALDEEKKKSQTLLEKAYLDTINILKQTVDAKDPYTRGHSDRVSAYCVLLGKKLGCDEATLKTLKIGGLFHDIGKIGVPDSVLLKNGKLDDKEYELIKKHSTIGAKIFGDAEMFNSIIPIVLYHHERFDGNGYPDKIKGVEIPYIARICTVVDTFDAMTSKRSYRNVLPLDIVKAEIEKCSGSQFDPIIATAWLDILDNNYEEIEKIQSEFPPSDETSVEN